MSVPPTEAHKARARELVRQRRAARIPSAAIEAGARALAHASVRFIEDYQGYARAVLEAASERIECPALVHHQADVGGVTANEGCAWCGGSGFLFVLRTKSHESG